jgi:hypothetical protein
MVSMLVIGPKVHGFKLSCVDRFSRAIKIHSMPSFKGGVKSSAPCHKILWHVKELYEV